MFERVYCINLERRTDRWNAFVDGLPKDWVYAYPERFAAVDKTLCPRPAWWLGGGGAWGCYRSHCAIIERCLNEGVGSVLIFEDDALFPTDFTKRAEEFLEALPADWEMAYLGGQHLRAEKQKPKRVNDLVYKPYNVNRTHAFALRGEGLKKVYKHLHKKQWSTSHHIDHHLGTLHESGTLRLYCPADWIVGQAESKSDISGRHHNNRFWAAAEELAGTAPVSGLPFVAVVGTHSSGSSCLAGVLHHLGVHMGNSLGGFYGNDPNTNCGFEAQGLKDVCESFIPFPAVDFKGDALAASKKLRDWAKSRRQEAYQKNTIAGGKYPQLCRMFDQLQFAVGDDLRVIFIDRPLGESIASLLRRENSHDINLGKHQQWLYEGKEAMKDSLPPEYQHSVSYEQLLDSPIETIHGLARFLKIRPKELNFERAYKQVKPGHRHIKPEATK